MVAKSVGHVAQRSEGSFDIEAANEKGDQYTSNEKRPWCWEVRGWVVRREVRGMCEIDVAMNKAFCNVCHDNSGNMKQLRSLRKRLRCRLR